MSKIETCQLINVSKSYGKKSVIKNFNLSIEDNELVCITGKSGAGKSTLLYMMGLLETPDSGVINLFQYKDIKPNSKIAKTILRNKIGFLFQNFALIDDKTVDYNLDIAHINSKLSKSKWHQRKQDVLEELHLDVSLNEKIYKLSGGEQQRVALARILLKDCDLILADEPTGSLDVQNRDAMIDILRKLNKEGKTIVIVSHDPYIANACNRIINLDKFSRLELCK